MSEDFSKDTVFTATRVDASGRVVSTVTWGVCQTVPGCSEMSACCERLHDSDVFLSCGALPTARFVLDRFLQFKNGNISFVAGVTLRYTGGDKASANYANTGSVDQAPLCFELDLKCDAVTKYFQLPNVDAILGTNKQACLRARVESQHGCVTNAFKALHLTSWKILFFIIAPLAMVSGLMLTFLGWRLFRITSLVLGLFFGLLIAGMAILFSVFLACEATKPAGVVDFWNWSHECTFHFLTTNVYIGWIASSVGLLFGLVLAVLAYWRPAFGGTLIGMTTGAWVADFMYVVSFSVLKQHWIVLVLGAVLIPLGAALGACLPNSWKRGYFIITISVTGAYLFSWGVGAYAHFFPTMSLLEELAGPRWQYYVYALAIAILGTTGAVVQFNITGAFDWDTLMESGLCPTRRRRGKGKAAVSLLAEGDVEMVPPPTKEVKKIVTEISDIE